jgi:hypothetical protein
MTEQELVDELNLLDPDEFRRPEHCDRLGRPRKVDALELVADVKKGRRYCRFNLMIGDESSAMLKIARHLRNLDLDEHDSLVEPRQNTQESTLVLLGFPQTDKGNLLQGTPFHLDRLSATNVGFAIGESSGCATYPIAVWYLLPAAHWDEFLGVAESLKLRWEDDVFSVEMAMRLSDRLGRSPCGHIPKLRMMYQFSGQVVHIKPGTYHSVLNLRPCLKIACDIMEPVRLPTYAYMLRNFFSENVRTNDYSDIETVIRRVLLNCAKRVYMASGDTEK